MIALPSLLFFSDDEVNGPLKTAGEENREKALFHSRRLRDPMLYARREHRIFLLDHEQACN